MYGRNTGIPHGPYLVGIARGLNHILGRHGTMIPGVSVLPDLARDSASSNLRLWTQYYRATPNGTTLVSRVVMLPSATIGVPSWYVKVDESAQATQQHSLFGGGSDLADMFYRDQEITVTGDAEHRLDLYTSDHCRVVGWYCWEKDRETLDSTADVMCDWSSIRVGDGIYDSSMQKLYEALVQCWTRCRGYAAQFNVPDPASPVAATSTLTNVWDGSVAWSAVSAGGRVPTAHRASYTGTTIAVTAWALAERTGGAGELTIRWAGTTLNTDITCDGALGIYKATGTISQLAGGEKLDLQLLAPAGTTGNLYAAGIYPFIA